MYLFTRSRRLAVGSLTEGVGWAVAATEAVRQTTGRDVDAWLEVLSPQVGTVTWSMTAETTGDVIDAGDKLAASSSFNDLLQQGLAHFDGPLVDGMASIVAGEPDPDAERPDYVVVVVGAAAPGRLGDAIAAGVEIATHASEVTGLSTIFAVNTTGRWGGVAWITPAPDVARLDAGQAALVADPDWLQLIDRVGTAFAPDAIQTLHRRIA